MRPAPFKISTTDMTVSGTPLEALMLIEPQIYGDERGFFLETHPILSDRHAQGMSLRDYMRRPAFVFDGARS